MMSEKLSEGLSEKVSPCLHEMRGRMQMLHCGKIVNTHGIAGEIKMLYYADSPDFFSKIKTLYLKNGEQLHIKSIRQHKGALILRIEGTDSVEKAEKLKNSDVYIKREDAPPLPDGRYYIKDILGLCVYLDDGRMLGRVSEVFATGSNDVYDVVNDIGKHFYIPVIDEVVKNIDINGGRIDITPIEGLIDDAD